MNALKSATLTAVVAILLWNQISHVRSEGVHGLEGSAWRFWDDMALAIGRYVDRGRTPRLETAGADLQSIVVPFRGLVEDKVNNLQVEPHQFWRTVPDKQFRNRLQPFAAPENEDPGRSLLLLAGFRLFGGVAPYFLLWVAPLAFLVPLFWIVFELLEAGRMIAAAVFGFLVALSPFWYECLSLPHSAIGFYLGAAVALAALAISVFLRPVGSPRPWRGVAGRGVLFTAIVVVAVWCRSGAIFMAPAGALVVMLGFHRSGVRLPRAGALALLLIMAPVILFRPGQVHNMWLPLWEGLGDFGSERGYSWYDADAGRFLAKQGMPLRSELRYVSAQEEGVFRKAFLEGVGNSPLWYATILAKRVVATTFLTHLDPYGPRDGESRRRPLFHYKYTTSVDWFGWKDQAREVPVTVLYVPTLLIVAGALAGRLTMNAELSVLGVIAFATLPVPVLISTAGALETQAFTLIYFLAAAFLFQRGADNLIGRFQRG